MGEPRPEGAHNNNKDSVGDEMSRSRFDKSSAFWQRWQGFTVALLYGVTSISITFFNKAVFAVYDFNASNFLTLGQIVFSLLFLVIMKRYKMLDFEDFNYSTAKALFSLNASFIGMVVTGLAALIYVNVPMYSALRRLTTFIVIAGQYLLLRKTVSQNELLAVIAMVVGAIIAGWGDLTFDPYGYFLTALNCVVTALYLVLIAKKSQETGLQTFGLMYYNNILSLPVMIVITLLTEWKILSNYTGWWNLGFQICFLMSSVQAFLLNYFMFLCSTVNSPLTTSITGQLKSILQTVFGLFAFNGVVLTPALSLGLFASTLGGVWYGVVKYNEQMDKIKKQEQHRVPQDIESGREEGAKSTTLSK